MKARNIIRFVAVVLALGLFSCDSNNLNGGPSEPGGGQNLLELMVVDSQGGPVAGLSAFVCYGSCSNAGHGKRATALERISISEVELDYFYSEVIGQEVSLYWGTLSESNNAGFLVQLEDGEDWVALGFVDGSGTTSEPQDYSFSVGYMGIGTHTFRLRWFDFNNGAIEYSEELPVVVNLAVPIQATGGYPNPFYSQNYISFAVDHDQDVVVSVLDLRGALVETLHNGFVVGNEEQNLIWNARDNTNVVSGIYRIQVSGETSSDSITVAYSDESSGDLALLMYLGETDLAGMFVTDDETRLPSLLDLEPIPRMNSQGNVLGTVPLSNDVTIILRDDSGAVRRYQRLLIAQSNLFELVWE